MYGNAGWRYLFIIFLFFPPKLSSILAFIFLCKCVFCFVFFILMFLLVDFNIYFVSIFIRDSIHLYEHSEDKVKEPKLHWPTSGSPHDYYLYNRNKINIKKYHKFPSQGQKGICTYTYLYSESKLNTQPTQNHASEWQSHQSEL